MALSMRHWNGNQLCAVDVETTGLDPKIHEIWQICILPLDSNGELRRGIMPFYTTLKMENPHIIDTGNIRISKDTICEVQLRGMDKEDAKDALLEWMKKLELPYTKFGEPKHIIPLAHNFAFDRAFLQAWLGDMFSQVFDYRSMDTMIIAQYLNDRAAVHAEPPPYQKLNLRWLSTMINAPIEQAHDALHDCVATAAVYRGFLKLGLF